MIWIIIKSYRGLGGSLASRVPSLRTRPPLSSVSESLSESSNGSVAFLSTGGPRTNHELYIYFKSHVCNVRKLHFSCAINSIQKNSVIIRKKYNIDSISWNTGQIHVIHFHIDDRKQVHCISKMIKKEMKTVKIVVSDAQGLVLVSYCFIRILLFEIFWTFSTKNKLKCNKKFLALLQGIFLR